MSGADRPVPAGQGQDGAETRGRLLGLIVVGVIAGVGFGFAFGWAAGLAAAAAESVIVLVLGRPPRRRRPSRRGGRPR